MDSPRKHIRTTIEMAQASFFHDWPLCGFEMYYIVIRAGLSQLEQVLLLELVLELALLLGLVED